MLGQDNSLLHALQHRRQFIVYRLVPRVDGRTDKVPTNPSNGLNTDAHDRSAWMLPAEALSWAKQCGDAYGVGIVICDGCGIGAIDIDGAAIYAGDVWQGWQPIAETLCARFRGACVEVSTSGRGLHILFSYSGAPPNHGTRNSQYHLEMYTRARFIALTGHAMIGDVLFDATAQLHATAAEFFPPTTEAPIDATQWTLEPVATYAGPDDDQELINIGLRMRSAAGTFGNKARFIDLWNGDANALAITFPPNPDSGGSYNASDADQALANHLAWLTGNHCERMYDLMLQSALVRSKWERDDYLKRTILKACAWTQSHYTPSRAATSGPINGTAAAHILETHTGTAEVSVPLPPQTPDTPPDNYASRPGEYVPIHALIELWKGFVWVEDINAIFIPPPHAWTLTKERFDIRFGGRRYQNTPDGQKSLTSAWECFTASEMHDFPKVEGLYFDPREPPGQVMQREGRRVVNSWMPVEIEMVPGDPSPFVDHIHKILPAGQDAMILIYYLATLLQYKGVKSKWAPLIQGVEGNGKSLLSMIMKRCLGRRYSHDGKASQIDAKFNASFYGKLLVVIEEIQINEDKGSVWETLKTMITEETMEIEAKGVDKVTREVCFNFIFNSNHQDAIRKTGHDRRIAPFFAAQQTIDDLRRDGMLDDDDNSKYFDKLFDWLNTGGFAIVAHYLMHLPIPDALNFAVRCRRAPKTTSTTQSIAVSMGSIEQDIIEATQAGHDGFANGWLSSGALDQLLERTGKAKYMKRSQRKAMLYSMGYILHPGLNDGRATLPINNQRPQLYVKRGHLSLTLKGADATGAYLMSQKNRG
jgi:hypothetical protein